MVIIVHVVLCVNVHSLIIAHIMTLKHILIPILGILVSPYLGPILPILDPSPHILYLEPSYSYTTYMDMFHIQQSPPLRK